MRNFFVSAEDLAGNLSLAANQTLQILVDTAGPQVTNVTITRSPLFNLFSVKQNGVIQGPTPAVNGLTIALRDLPARQSGFLPNAISNPTFYVSDRVAVAPGVGTNPATLFNEFSPFPLGNDLFAQFGNEYGLPLCGNFDPPVSGSNSADPLPSLTKPLNSSDVNNDGKFSPIDVLIVINALNRGLDIPQGANPARALALSGGSMMDSNSDGRITPMDALRIINVLNRRGEGEGEQVRESSYAAAVDLVLLDFESEDDDRLILRE
jgi:hypothetical protein